MRDKPAAGVGRYAMIGNRRGGALLDREGSIDWWCAPRFDSAALFAAILGDAENGRWTIAPREGYKSRRSYAGETLVHQTVFEHRDGSVRLTDFMPDADVPTIVRIAESIAGSSELQMDLVQRMQYGHDVPASTGNSHAWTARSGGDAVRLRSDVCLRDDGGACRARFVLHPGTRARFVLQWSPADAPAPPAIDADEALESTLAWWESWVRGLRYEGYARRLVVRSAIMLKALTDRTTGAIMAASTTSLPEQPGGKKNWDYRYCWLRDAGFAISSLIRLGAVAEAEAFRDWFMRTYDGDPQRLHIMYETSGETLGPERSLPWLRGFDDSRPVRVSNGAHDQFQLGIFGQLLGCFTDAANAGVPFGREHGDRLAPIADFLERVWQKPGNGIWESRAERRQYVDSKVMAWRAADRLQHLLARCGVADHAEQLTGLRAAIRREMEQAGFDPRRRTFTQYYGSRELDASTLLIPLVDFLPPDDPRVRGTVAAIERELMRDGLVFRYSRDTNVAGGDDGEAEGTFTACGFWLVQVLARMGRLRQARKLFERVAATANDVGLLSEEYDADRGIPIGNVPQALSHSGLIDAAVSLDHARRTHDSGDSHPMDSTWHDDGNSILTEIR